MAKAFELSKQVALENGKRVRQYIYLTSKEKLKIKEVASKNGLTVSRYITKLIKEELEKNPSLDLG